MKNSAAISQCAKPSTGSFAERRSSAEIWLSRPTAPAFVPATDAARALYASSAVL
ncbi:hypothetical protein RS86_00987 [Microbacterium azadirachtae]|uniref:Uncharacterized protein n=1 Tax=Microbacterium azadirachtae TaxID=582680 RepID=A0A0F0LRS8_9MICO|nr:hypothetical protein RS86_00987 [Microbacterium azadirachtae]